MSDLSPEEQYQKEYKEAMEKLDSTDAGKQPAATIEPAKTEPVAQEPAKAAPATPEAAKTADEPPETLAEIKARLEKAEKALKDTQAWGTKNAQQLAEIRKQQEKTQRDASRPAFLDANPELEEVVKYVVNDPAPQQQAAQKHDSWMQTIEAAHPGIFAKDADPELVEALVKKRDENPDAWNDPLVAIRDIAAEKVAYTERQVGKRFAIEAQKQAEKSAMSVPAANGNGAARKAPDADAEAVNRIKNMSDADFAKEVKKVKGY
jgi:hypothetical protein